MTVQFNAALGRNSTVQNMMTQLHTTLIAAGWEIVHANADAIGTGTASNPAWTKTPAVSASAGIVTYRMPLVSGYPTRWVAQIEAAWTTATAITWGVRVTWATDSSSGGVLTGAGTPHLATAAVSSASTNQTSTEWYIIADEHNVLIALHAAGSGWLYSGGRRRRLDGTILDDLSTYATIALTGSPASISVGGVTGAVQGIAMSRTATSESTAQRWVVFADSAGGVPYTLNRMDGATGIPQGPINVSGGTAGMPRLFAFLPSNDAVAGVDSSLYVDGATRAYHVTTTTGITAGSALQTRIAYAKE